MVILRGEEHPAFGGAARRPTLGSAARRRALGFSARFSFVRGAVTLVHVSAYLRFA
jgi:hypothetical protein